MTTKDDVATGEGSASGSTETTDPSSHNLPVVYAPPETARLPGFFERLAYLFRPRANASVRQNLELALEGEGHLDQTISPAERAMLQNILSLREVRVADVMIARAEIEAADMSTPLGELLKQFDDSGHSRLPVYVETLDDPRGMIHIRDVMAYMLSVAKKRRRRRKRDDAEQTAEARPTTSQAAMGDLDLSGVDLQKSIGALKLARPVIFVPPSMPATDLLARMQAERTQMALVIDEYGGTDGLVSLEDIVEMVVGDIEDEHDDEEVRVEKRADGSYLIDARAEISELDAHLGDGFMAAAQSVEDEVDTLGGLIFAMLGRVPLRGEVLHDLPGFEIEVRDADPRRIRTAIVKHVRQPARRRGGRASSKLPPDGQADVAGGVVGDASD